jgi:hypothetical protein
LLGVQRKLLAVRQNCPAFKENFLAVRQNCPTFEKNFLVKRQNCPVLKENLLPCWEAELPGVQRKLP